MKDLFIDNNIASKFTNPIDPEYKKLIAWLKSFDAIHPDNNAYLVVSHKLIAEYTASAREANTSTCIHTIINQLVIEGRRNFISNDRIKEFKRTYYSKKRLKAFRSNKKDWEHIPIVLFSDRKYVLSYDEKFIYDLTNFPGFIVRAEKRPELLPYK